MSGSLQSTPGGVETTPPGLQYLGVGTTPRYVVGQASKQRLTSQVIEAVETTASLGTRPWCRNNTTGSPVPAVETTAGPDEPGYLRGSTLGTSVHGPGPLRSLQ